MWYCIIHRQVWINFLYRKTSHAMLGNVLYHDFNRWQKIDRLFLWKRRQYTACIVSETSSIWRLLTLQYITCLLTGHRWPVGGQTRCLLRVKSASCFCIGWSCRRKSKFSSFFWGRDFFSSQLVHSSSSLHLGTCWKSSYLVVWGNIASWKFFFLHSKWQSMVSSSANLHHCAGGWLKTTV